MGQWSVNKNRKQNHENKIRGEFNSFRKGPTDKSPGVMRSTRAAAVSSQAVSPVLMGPPTLA